MIKFIIKSVNSYMCLRKNVKSDYKKTKAKNKTTNSIFSLSFKYDF